MKNLVFFLLMIICISCQNKPKITESYLGTYSRDTIYVKPDKQDKLDAASYEITDFVSLELPSIYSYIDFHQVKITKERIYVLDQKFNKTVFAFDRKGRFLFIMGKFGHARDEFVDKPTFFDIDKVSGDIYIHEEYSHKILVFNNIGKYIKTIMIKDDICPSNIVRTDEGHFMFSMSCTLNSSSQSALSLHDESMKLIKPLLKYTDENRDRRLPWFETSFFHDTRIAFTPFGADSVILFSGDKVEKVLKIDFDGHFIPEEIIDEACMQNTWEPILNHEGVQFIDVCEVTDSLIHIRYSYLMHRYHYIQYLSDNRSYNSHNDGFLKYGSWGPFCTIYEDNIVYSYSDDDIKNVKNKYKHSTNDVKTGIMNGTMPLVKRIIEDNISGPALMMVKLK